MFHCDQLLYIQMQKTGCTHITSLLSHLFDGSQSGIHHPATQDQIANTHYCVSSIRNPWDWYLSLWTYGAQGNGALMKRLTQKKLGASLKKAMKNPKKNYHKLIYELSKDASLWKNVYTDSDSPELFRSWLKLIHNPDNSHILGEGYGATNIAGFCGFMTYRYLYLCCQNVNELKTRTIANYDDLVNFDNNNCYIDFFVRQESLEDTLCEILEKVRPLKPEERAFIYGAKKSNTSRRKLLITDYYDNESIELIHHRDRLLIEKFKYSPPT